MTTGGIPGIITPETGKHDCCFCSLNTAGDPMCCKCFQPIGGKLIDYAAFLVQQQAKHREREGK